MSRKAFLKNDSAINAARLIIFIYYNVIATQPTYSYGDRSSAITLPNLLRLSSYERKYGLWTRLDGPGEARALPEMYVVADRYLVPTLSKECVMRLQHTTMAQQLEVWWVVREFVDEAEIDCQLLRDMLVSIASAHAKAWCEDQKFQEYLTANGDFGLQLVRAIAKS